jgi:Fe-S cluster biogenesis protein NfuA
MIFTDQEIYEAVKNNLPQVSSYVNSHGGDITLLGVKDSIVYIELIGTCKGCAMSIMTTKMVVQKELRALIHPELVLINVDGTAENKLPDDYYTQETIEDQSIKTPVNKPTMMDKIKTLITNN